MVIEVIHFMSICSGNKMGKYLLQNGKVHEKNESHKARLSHRPVLTQLSFQSHELLTCFRDKRRKYAAQKVCLNQLLNSQ